MDNPQLDYRGLHSAYREAWTRFSALITLIGHLSSQVSDETRVKDALQSLDFVEYSYRERRNALAAFLLSNAAGKGHLVSSVLGDLRAEEAFAGKWTDDFQFAVRQQAHRYWEERGQGDGQAICDWIRAEKCVQQQRRSEYTDTEAA